MSKRFGSMGIRLCAVLILLSLLFSPRAMAEATPAEPSGRYPVYVTLSVDEQELATLGVSGLWQDDCVPVYLTHVVDFNHPLITVFTNESKRPVCCPVDDSPWQFSIALGKLPFASGSYTVRFHGAFEYETVVPVIKG